MSEIKCLTLISDPTDEFPNNANNSFKVRLPERLSLPGEGWHASLLSLTVPDQGQSNAVVAADPHTKVIKFKMNYVIRKFQSGTYRRVETKTVDCVLELEEIMNASQIVSTGSQFWKRVMQEMHNKIMHNVMAEQMRWLVAEPDQKPIVSAKQNAMPRLTWKKGALVIKALPRTDLIKENKTAITEFFINLDIALKFGLVEEKKVNNATKYFLGPNLQYTLPTSTYYSDTPPKGISDCTPYNWEGVQYMGVSPALLFASGDPSGCEVFAIVLDSGMAIEQPGCLV